MNPQQSPQRHGIWGHQRPAWFWLTSIFAGGPLLALCSLVGGTVSGLIAMSLLSMLAGDPRLRDTLWGWLYRHDHQAFSYAFIFGLLVTALAVLARWAHKAITRVKIDKESITSWSLAGRKKLRWEDMVRAFVTRSPDQEQHLTLHLWTPWRDLAISMDQIADEVSHKLQRESFEVFLQEIRGHLEGHGLALEEDVPVSTPTDTSWPLFYSLFWPHRRILSLRQRRMRRQDLELDQRAELPSLRLAWLMRPAPVMTTVSFVVALVAVRWGTVSDWAMSLALWGGVLMVALIPIWNLLKERVSAGQQHGALTPEMLVGRHDAPEKLPNLLLPARGCRIDLNRGQISRPDGKAFNVKDINVVDYGPPGRYGQDKAKGKGMRQQAWHLAVGTSTGPGKMVEIFHNASADIVRHGDVDAGYAVFNWTCARAIAQHAQADLILAQGRVHSSKVGRPLLEALHKDVVQYEPEPLQAQLDMERSGVHIRQSPERFEAWGPLVRQPEACAAPPLWKGVLILGAMALLPTGFLPAGMIIGWLLASLIHDAITAMHFGRPGFMMDKEGVWVRGVCLPWEELEQSTLMPVAPGPILFAGRRRVLVVGYLGGTYTERAWLGCAAYRWAQKHLQPQP